MGDATSEQVYKYTVSTEEGKIILNVKGISKKDAKEWLETHLSNIKFTCAICAKEKQDSHKCEDYPKPQVNKNVCRDEHCKAHYNKPIMLPPKLKNIGQPPPLWGPPPRMPFFDQMQPGPSFWQQPNPMYHSMPPPLLLPDEEFSGFSFPNLGGGYNRQW